MTEITGTVQALSSSFSLDWRFTPGRCSCPRCGGPTVQDNWPPSVGGGNLTAGRSQDWSYLKHVCLSCQIAFNVHWERVMDQDGWQERYTMGDILPLAQYGDQWLMPHDQHCRVCFAGHGM